MKKYPNDNRMRAWLNLDNFTADLKFKKLILMPIVAIKREFAHDVDMQAFNPLRVVGVLERYPLSEPIKMMLNDMQGHGAACGISGKEVVENYEKEKVLAKLCDVIAHTKRKLEEDEKEFLFRYIHDAVVDGFDVGVIGLNDAVFSRLMADVTKEELSEIEMEPRRQRNADIVDFAKNFDGKYGFYDMTAAKLIRYNSAHIQEMIERCMSLMDKTDPKGIVFALELIEFKQVKSAVKIIIELAKRLKGILCHVNLIPVNNVRETDYIKSTVERQKKFIDILASRGITATVRRTLGSDINASCGQLRASKKNK